ncbi:MAG: hypothetical protein ACUVS3_03365 [Thermodesulfobacteriota bacterium]
MDLEERWRRLQAQLGYSDEEVQVLRSNPKYRRMVEGTPQFVTHRIVAEVIRSHGCHSQLKVGDRIVMNGSGQLIRDECPQRICIWALAPLAPVVNTVFERFVAQLDPNDLLFDVVHCQDVGLECGGWGQILMKVRVEAATRTNVDILDE